MIQGIAERANGEPDEASTELFQNLISRFGIDGMSKFVGLRRRILAGEADTMVANYPLEDGQIVVTETDVTFTQEAQRGHLSIEAARELLRNAIDSQLGYPDQVPKAG